MPTISKGWENDSCRVTLRLSSCMTIGSEGITMPKWADTDVTHKNTGIHADAKIKIFFMLSSFKKKKPRVFGTFVVHTTIAASKLRLNS